MARQPIHSRGSSITGQGRLNQKAVKVLATIKFSPKSISREDIAEDTGLPLDDVERQVKLLLQLNLIKSNARFPSFPSQGWRVFTKPDDHLQITRLLEQHGYRDPRVEETRRILGDYYPTGMALEGKGRQPDRGFSYTQGHPIIPELEFRPEAQKVMAIFRDEKKPFRPKQYSQQAVEEKKRKWKWFVKKMSEAYGIRPPTVSFGTFSEESWYRPGASANDDQGRSSSYNRGTHTLFFTGKFSLTTLLHEFGHARGFDERDTIIWSINIGIRFFPVTYNRLIGTSEQGTHMLTRTDETETRFEL